jgi:hypothetical protein
MLQASANYQWKQHLSFGASVQVLTWLALPFFQVYADAGDFTVGGRCMTSLKENGLLYGLAGAAGDWGGAKGCDRQQRYVFSLTGVGSTCHNCC